MKNASIPAPVTVPINIQRGSNALALMHDSEFQQEWTALAHIDPRITVFQEPAYCLAWFSATEASEEAILLTRRREGNNALDGVMVLSRKLESGAIRHAGAHQAIYDGWISAPDEQANFAEACVEAVFENFEIQTWIWRHLPPGSPVEWAKRNKPKHAPWASQIETYPLPAWDFGDDAFFKRKAKSKRLRNYANRYRKQGNLCLETVSRPEEIKRLMHTLAIWVDFRQGAVHQTMPFRQDPTKAQFYTALVQSGPNTRMTVLKLDDRPLAIQIDSVHGKTLSLCLHGYDPAEGQRSPGMILLALLAQDLREEGITRIDLTPGEKTWKDDFANEWQEGFRVEFHGHYRTVAKETSKRGILRLARSALRRVGIEATEAKQQAEYFRSSLRHGPKALQEYLSDSHGPRAFLISLEASVSSIGPALRSKPVDAVGALLDLASTQSAEDQQLLLFDSLKRFERGAIPFARAIEEAGETTLVQLSWLHLPPNSDVPPPATQDHALASKIDNILLHIECDPKTEGFLVISYEQGLYEDPISVLTPAFQHARDTGLDELIVIVTAQHQSSLRWLAGRATAIPLKSEV